jgi:hypothetical protein
MVIIPVLQLHERFAFHWRGDSPICELYVADLEALSAVCLTDVIAAGLPGPRTVGHLCAEAILIRGDAESSGRWGRVDFPFQLSLDGASGCVVERWMSRNPWALIAARLRRVA